MLLICNHDIVTKQHKKPKQNQTKPAQETPNPPKIHKGHLKTCLTLCLTQSVLFSQTTGRWHAEIIISLFFQ